MTKVRKTLVPLLVGVTSVLILLFISGCGVTVDTTTKKANQTYTVKETCSALYLEAEGGEVSVLCRDVEAITVEYFADEKITVTVTEEEGTLKIKQDINSFFVSYSGEIRVTMPENNGDYNLEIKLNAGILTVDGVQANNLNARLDAGGLTFENGSAQTARLSVGAGELAVKNCTLTRCTADVGAGEINGENLTLSYADLSVDLGEITVTLNGLQSEYSLTGKTSLGESNFTDQTGSTDKYLTAEVDCGNIDVTFSS